MQRNRKKTEQTKTTSCKHKRMANFFAFDIEMSVFFQLLPPDFVESSVEAIAERVNPSQNAERKKPRGFLFVHFCLNEVAFLLIITVRNGYRPGGNFSDGNS